MATLGEQIREALARVRYPGFERDLVSLGVLADLHVSEDRVDVELVLGPGQRSVEDAVERDVRAALQSLPGVSRLGVRFREAGGGSPALKMATPQRSAAAAGAFGSDLIPGVRHAIAVASGKGGVGKSTVAVNLAVALARGGASVGLLDADVYGPSIPLMTGIDEQPRMTPGRRLLPFERFGVKIMSLGFLVDAGAAVIWRGPMVMKALEQLLRDVEWGALEYLILDLPPGTGDAQLTLSQRIRLAGAVIVTTPQDVALADARKGVAMFRKVDVPVLGVIENMSFFRCPHCGERAEIFGHGGGRAEAKRLGVPFLGEIPLDPAVRSGGDAGEPFAADESPSDPSRTMLEIAEALRTRLASEGDPGDGGPSVFDRLRGLLGGADRGSS